MYHVGRNGQQTGPFSIDQLRAMAANGELSPTDLVWKEGMSGWEPASTLPGVFSSASEQAPSAQPSPAPLAEATVLPPSAFGGGPQQNPMALTGMILGITSVTVGLCCCYGLPFSIAGIICSVIAMNQLKANPSQTGKGMATAGLWCSIASLVLAGLFLVLGVALNFGDIMNEIKKQQH